jgi:DNA-binding transcriptional ArsR family regulator
MSLAADPAALIFAALADATRRGIVERLSAGAASVMELAAPFRMALPSFTQHLKVLETCGLVKSSKAGRVRTYELVPAQLQVAEDWMQQQRRVWETRLNRLDQYLLDLKEKRRGQ